MMNIFLAVNKKCFTLWSGQFLNEIWNWIFWLLNYQIFDKIFEEIIDMLRW